MTLEELDELLHAYGWHRPFADVPRPNYRWYLEQTRDPGVTPISKETMVALLIMANIKPQTSWADGRDIGVYIIL